MSKPREEGLTRAHLKRLGFFTLAGGAIFVALLVALQAALAFAGHPVDSSIYKFYPILAGLGAAFGFERWWAHEQGDVNPFHDK
ncbi:MAG: hypothetical protein LYZ70_06775 [Nitrososphaerales archaeon]|nr:hypothetical protein [Nitrososphaerales archaeon]